MTQVHHRTLTSKLRNTDFPALSHSHHGSSRESEEATELAASIRMGLEDLAVARSRKKVLVVHQQAASSKERPSSKDINASTAVIII